MADEQTTTTDTSGVTRTGDGTIADQGTTTSPATTTQTSTTETPPKTEQSNDGKSVLNQKAEGEKKEEPAAKGAPEKYEDFKAPDGQKLDPAVIAKASPIFKELGLPQDAAQKLVDTYRELTAEAQAAPYKAYQDTVAGWLKEAQDHPDLRGKLGPGQEVNVRIGKFLDGLPDQKLASDFRQVMDTTGAGNNPAFIRVMDYVSKQLTEGSHVAGNGPSPGGQSAPGARTQPTAAQSMWPNLPSAGDRR